MSIWYKQGVFGNLQPETSEGLRKTAKLYAKYGKDVYVTSIQDGTHLPFSLHNDGRAWDQRLEGVPLSEHKKTLGPNFDIIDHGSPKHRHIEYDPK